MRQSVLRVCLEFLHRHPDEVDLSMDALVEILAFTEIKAEENLRKG